jgi:hypothetical protein
MTSAEKKATLSVEVDPEVMVRVRTAVALTPGTTLEGLVEEALREAIDKLEKERGRPFPQPLAASRLTGFALFSDAGEETLAEILPEFEEDSYSKEDLLFQQGQVANAVYLLEEGSIGIFHGEAADAEFVKVLEAPALVGGKDLMAAEHIRTVSAKALTDIRLLTIKVKPLLSFVKRFPPLKDKLRKIVVEGGY